MRVRQQFQRASTFEMRSSWLWVPCALSAWLTVSAVTLAQPVRRAAVLELDTDALREDVVARRLTQRLRAVVAERSDVQLRDTRISLEQLSIGNGCSSESAECLLRVSRQLGVDVLIVGRTEQVNGQRSVRLARFERTERAIAATASASLPASASSDEQLELRARELISEVLDFKNAPQTSVLAASADVASAPLVLEPPFESANRPGLDARHITGYALLGGAVVSTGLSVLSWVQIERAQTNDSLAAYRRSVGQMSPSTRDVCDEAKSGQSFGLDSASFAKVKSSCSAGKTFEVLQFVFLGGAVISGGLSAFLLFGGDHAERPKSGLGTFTLHPSVNRRGASLGARMHF